LIASEFGENCHFDTQKFGLLRKKHSFRGHKCKLMAERTFKRKIYDKKLEWKQRDDGRTALLIQGARRVGKSTIAEVFAQREYDSYILIDFAISFLFESNN